MSFLFKDKTLSIFEEKKDENPTEMFSARSWFCSFKNLCFSHYTKLSGGRTSANEKDAKNFSALKSKTKQPKTDCYPHIAFLILMKLGSTRSDVFETL